MSTPFRPRQGRRVVDFSRLLPGPFCSLLLADLGAEVIKIEEPGSGDYARWYAPMVGEYSGAFAALNRDKRIEWYTVESENFESIHNHSAYALIEKDKTAK